MQLTRSVMRCRLLIDALGKKLTCKPAKAAAEQMGKQYEQIQELLHLPIQLIVYKAGETAGEKAYTVRLVRLLSQVKSLPADPKEGESVFQQLADRAFQEVVGRGSKMRVATEARKAADTLIRVTETEEIRASLRPLLLAAITHSWTCFECLASDLWVAALNAEPRRLAQRVLGSMESDLEEDGISARHLSVGLAAKHNFDLRHCLGTLLEVKFDFSSVSGIQKAYEAAFGKSKRLEEVMRPELRELEQVRHLIVHRGGISDEKFIKVTKLKVRRNAALQVKPAQVRAYAESVIIGSAGLLEIVDEWMQSPGVKPSNEDHPSP